jgi:RNA polymerase sigma-70 factor (ECF subfamily)
LNYLRRASRTVPINEEAPSPDTVSYAEEPLSRLEKNERIRLVNRFLGLLKPSYREVLILREYQNLSYQEIAAVTRSSISAVKSRLFKARKRMAHLLQPFLAADEPSKNERATSQVAVMTSGAKR